jgi:predicted RNA-binding protein YlqC (UPF0109 family)
MSADGRHCCAGILARRLIRMSSKEHIVERDLVEYIAKSLVDDPASVNVAVVEGDKSTILELRVASEDIGKVIGKHGRIAKAIRTILSATSAASNKRVVLEILD